MPLPCHALALTSVAPCGALRRLASSRLVSPGRPVNPEDWKLVALWIDQRIPVSLCGELAKIKRHDLAILSDATRVLNSVARLFILRGSITPNRSKPTWDLCLVAEVVDPRLRKTCSKLFLTTCGELAARIRVLVVPVQDDGYLKSCSNS